MSTIHIKPLMMSSCDWIRVSYPTTTRAKRRPNAEVALFQPLSQTFPGLRRLEKILGNRLKTAGDWRQFAVVR
jgi:hypothetical protein